MSLRHLVGTESHKNAERLKGHVKKTKESAGGGCPHMGQTKHWKG